MPTVTISTFGTIISLTEVSPSLRALLAIIWASLSITLDCLAFSKNSETSATVVVFIKKGFLKYFLSFEINPEGGFPESGSILSFIVCMG